MNFLLNYLIRTKIKIKIHIMLKFNLLSLFLVVSYAQYVMDGDVIVVDYDKLEIAIKEFPYLLLEAYSPKCSRWYK